VSETPSDAAEPRAAADIAIVGGNPTAVEVAAVTAVLTGVLEELANELGRTEAAGPSAWQRSQRPIRSAVHPGAGVWRGFSG